jgi:hypothetical protein
MTDCTERHFPGPRHDRDGEGRKGIAKEALR